MEGSGCDLIHSTIKLPGGTEENHINLSRDVFWAIFERRIKE
jgi:hypothetical protein